MEDREISSKSIPEIGNELDLETEAVSMND